MCEEHVGHFSVEAKVVAVSLVDLVLRNGGCESEEGISMVTSLDSIRNVSFNLLVIKEISTELNEKIQRKLTSEQLIGGCGRLVPSKLIAYLFGKMKGNN